MAKKISQIFCLIVLLMPFLFFNSNIVYAQEANGVELVPFYIDEKVEAGDKLKYKLHFKNNLQKKVRMYAIVNDITSEGGRQEFTDPHYLDKTKSVARWIRITRNNIEFMPGEEGDINLEIIVNTRAVPGKYFAAIAFPQGINPKVAEDSMKQKSFPELRISIEVKDKSVTKAQIKNFFATKKIFFSAPINFYLSLKNLGTTNIQPKGEILIYNRRGEEVDKINVNENIKQIKVGQTISENIFWRQIKGTGRLKARLELEYGQKKKRDLIDTVYFWVLPWPILLLYIGGIFLILVLMIKFLFKRTYHEKYLSQQNYDHRENEEKQGIINLKK